VAQAHPFIPGGEIMGIGTVTVLPMAQRAEKAEKPRIRVAALGSRTDELVGALDALAAKIRAAAKSA
jgi:hypothetical protein